MESWPSKDPDEVLDYSFDWAEYRLEVGETILTSTWAVVAGSVTIGSGTPPAPTSVDGINTVWLSGGVLGEVCQLRNRVTTSEGRTMDMGAKLRIRSKG